VWAKEAKEHTGLTIMFHQASYHIQPVKEKTAVSLADHTSACFTNDIVASKKLCPKL